MAQVDAYTNAEQLSQTGQQNGNLKPSGPANTGNIVDVRRGIFPPLTDLQSARQLKCLSLTLLVSTKI